MSDWLETYRNVLSKDLRIYGCFQSDKLVGGCPLFVRDFKGILKIASSTSNMTDYCGPLIKENSSAKISKRVQETHEIFDALRKFLCREGFDSIHLRFSPEIEDIRLFTWNGWSSKVHYTHHLDLKENVDNKISRAIRKDLRFAIKAGIETKIWNDLETLL